MTNRIRIKITGNNPNTFLKELIRLKINLFDIEINNKELLILVDEEDYKKIKKIKTIYKIEVISKYGKIKYLDILNKYKILFISTMIGISITYILSNLIFSIEVNHQNKEIRETVLKDLQELGLKKYSFKPSYQKKEIIKTKLLEKEKNLLEWIEIKENGTKYIIEVVERKINNNKDNCQERSIVAKKSAVIISIEAESGEVVKKINDYVEKGETIISGFIYNKERVVSKRCSIGKVYGEVWYKVVLSVPTTINEEKLLKRKRYGLSINIFNNNYNLLNNFKTFKKDEYNIIGDKVIPFSISLCKYTETKKVIKKYNLNNINDIALKRVDKEMKKILKKDEELLSKKVLKKTLNNSKIEVEVFVKAKEDITDFFDISSFNIENMNKEGE